MLVLKIALFRYQTFTFWLLLVEIYGDSITSDIYIVICDGNVHVERLVVLCNVLQGIGFMLL